MRSTHLMTTIRGVIAASLMAMLVTAGVARSDNVQDVREISPTGGDPGRAATAFFARSDYDLESVNGSFTVPAGKRLVIEFVSMETVLPTGQKPRPSWWGLP